jgi:DNA-binding transcriptional ArsR family regulator
MNVREALMAEKCCITAEDQGLALAPAEDSAGTDLDLATIAKALGHPARVQIIRFLQSRDSCMCGDIVEHLPLAQSTVSQHLKTLKEAGLIRGTIDGPRVCYCVEPKVLRRFKRLVSDL